MANRTTGPLIAAAYIRVSTDDQTEYSPDAQLKALRRYASQNSMIMQLQDNLAMLREDVESLRNDIALIIQEPHLKFKYYRYKILSKISFGAKRAKYKKKKIFFRNLLRQSKMTRRKYMQI